MPRPAEALRGLRRVVEGAHLELNPDKTKVIGPEGEWPQRVLGVEIDLAGGALRPRRGKTSGRRRKSAFGR